MAGTDRTRWQEAGAVTTGPAPVVILVEPQLGENIGAAARAMLNFGLTELRLVAPRDGWPNEAATASASGAVEVIENAQVFATFEEAVADCHCLYATTARPREMIKPVLSPQGAVQEMNDRLADGQRVGLLFGREKSGLHNDHIAVSDAIITFPVNPAFASLNLAQAVLLVGYEWFSARANQPARLLEDGRDGRASQQDLLGLYEHLEDELIAGGFLFPKDKRPNMIRNLRSIFARADLMTHEVRTLRGVIKSLIRLGQRREQGEVDYD